MFYENFDRICKERKTSASAAALAIGKAKNTAWGWKRNRTIPKEDELIALAKHLHCRVADFFREDGQVHFKSREDTVEAMVGSVMDYAASRPNMADHYREELAEVTRRRDKLVASIAEGIDPSAVKDAVNGCVERMKDLDKLIAKEEFEHSSLLDEAQVREYLARFVDKADGDQERSELLVSTFIDLVYADEEKAVVLFILDGAEEVPFEEIQALANHEHPLNRSSEGVRASILWWSRVTLARNLYRHNQAFALVVILPKRQ